MVSSTDYGGLANDVDPFEPTLQPANLSKGRKSAVKDAFGAFDAFGIDPFEPNISKVSAAKLFLKATQLKGEGFSDDGEGADLGWATDQFESDDEGSVYSKTHTVISTVEPSIKKISSNEFDWFLEIESDAESSVSERRRKERKMSKKKKKDRNERTSHKSSLLDVKDTTEAYSEKRREKKSKKIKDGDVERKMRRSKDTKECKERLTGSTSKKVHRASEDGDASELENADVLVDLDASLKRQKSKMSRKKATDSSVNSHETISTHSSGTSKSILGSLLDEILETDGHCIERKKEKMKAKSKEGKSRHDRQSETKNGAPESDKIDEGTADTISTTNEQIMEIARSKACEQLVVLTPKNAGGGKVKIKVKVACQDNRQFGSPIKSPQSVRGTRSSLSSLFSRSSPTDNKRKSTNTISGFSARSKSQNQTSSAQTVCGASPATMKQSISFGGRMKEISFDKSPLTNRKFGLFSPSARIIMSPLTPKKPSIKINEIDVSLRIPQSPKSKLRDREKLWRDPRQSDSSRNCK